MPYICEEDRKRALFLPANAGELNYSITDTCLHYLAMKGKNYTTLNEIVGALECAKLELYRRVVAPYEDKKIIENGDVYP